MTSQLNIHTLYRPLLLALAFTVTAPLLAYAKPAPDLPGIFTGGAAAPRADASLGVLALTLQRLAAQGCPCQGSNGRTLTNEVGAVNLPGLISVGATTSSAMGEKTATTADTTQIATVGSLSLFGGMITADGLVAEASVDATETTLTSSQKGSQVLGLVIAGKRIEPKPNTVVPLAGIGTVTVFAIDRSGGAAKHAIEVDMLKVVLADGNTLGLPAGAVIKIASAIAGYERRQPSVAVTGLAYVTDVNIAAGTTLLTEFGSVGVSGITSCVGTGRKTNTNSVAALSAGGIAIQGGETTAFGGRTGHGTSIAQTKATVTGINLLGGLITASAITAEATENADKQVVTSSTSGTEFGSLSVAGLALPLDVPPNTTIPLPSIGHVVVNEQSLSSGANGSAVVNGLHIVVDTPNLFSLPVGAEIIVAHAAATAFPLPR